MPNGDCPIGAGLAKDVQRNKDDLRVYKQEIFYVDKKVDGIVLELGIFKTEIKTSLRWLAIIGGVFMTIIGPLITAGLMYLSKIVLGG